MRVEERRASPRVGDGSGGRFPVGMRVLAVDDDPTCLKLLENLLRRCEYHVTTTNQAVTALKLLREKKDNFDLVISDVHMPDMDGFKLLELVGLEMDLPVIMLSANSDPKAVMKGITHGACDYLLKPVRVEELKNIWQHVIRRRKVDSKCNSKFAHVNNCVKLDHGTGEDAEPASMIATADASGKAGKRRKDETEEDDDDEGKCGENEHCNEDPSMQKRPRVVWSVELHRKFVAAVNQLGIERAVPKRILDLMNVEKLTRENVASHLQKYRLYLKRISNVSSQQANIPAVIGVRDLSCLRRGTLNGIGDFHAFPGSAQLPQAASSSGSGTNGRLNSPSALAVNSLSTSEIYQLGHAQIAANSVSNLAKFQGGSFNGNQKVSMFQGIKQSLNVDQVQQNRSISHTGGYSSPRNSKTIFSGPSPLMGIAGVDEFPESGVVSVSSGAPLLNVPNNAALLHGQQRPILSSGLGNKTSHSVGAVNLEPYNSSVGASSFLPDQSRCREYWQNAVPSSLYTSNQVPMNASYNRDNLSTGKLRDNAPSMTSSYNGIESFNVSPNSAVASCVHDSLSRNDPFSQINTFGVNMQSGSWDINQNSKLPIFRSINSVVQNISSASKQKSEEYDLEYIHDPSVILNSDLSAMLPNNIIKCTGQNLGKTNVLSYMKADTTAAGQMISGASYDKLTAGSSKLNKSCPLDQAKPQGIHSICYNSYENPLGTYIKQEQEEVALPDGDIGCDIYSLSACM